VGALLVLAGLGVGFYALHAANPDWYARLWYPLEYEATIRAESVRNDLEPALVAAVIYRESGFVPDKESHQGAVGLMQVLPSTARFIATLPDRPSPAPDMLTDPAVNIAYGTRYLRYLIGRYGDIRLVLTAYNAGESNLSGWLREARADGRTLRIPEDVPFEETRGFVRGVLDALDIYRRAYRDRLEPRPGEG
jgi:soluble lytic murein transglycosylase